MNQTVTATYRNNTTTLELVAVYDCELTKGQAEKAAEFGAEYVFKTANTESLPKYVHNALISARLDYIKIGHTSYKSATWAAAVVV